MSANSKTASKRRNLDDPSSSSAAATAFVPQLSRRVKACDECRKHKIRCNLPANGAPPCGRCVKIGTACKLTKSLQSILEERQSDSEWKTSVERRFDAILKAMEGGASLHAVQELQQVMREEGIYNPHPDEQLKGSLKRKYVDDVEDSDSPADGNLGLLATTASVGESTLSKPQWVDEELPEPASVPGDHLRQLADPMKSNSLAKRRTVPGRQSDIIDRGLITLEQACTLIDLYLQKLDGQVYWIVTRRHHQAECSKIKDTVSSIRSSSLLLLSICTVASLHCNQALDESGVLQGSSSSVAARLHSALYNEFVRISAQRSFVRHQSMDDVRALLIASWWLRDLSWILTASSVRLATERGMQEAFKKCSDIRAGKKWVSANQEQACFAGCALRGLEKQGEEEEEVEEYKSVAFEEARLYYLVYIADHHASIPFGRPPMTRQHAAVRSARAWLAGCDLATSVDAHIVSQVELWVIAHDAVDDFGVDVHQSLTRAQVLELAPRYITLLDRWRKCWLQMESKHADVEHDADMMTLFIDAHAFRAPPGVSPLLVQDGQDAGEEDLRDCFAFKAMPSVSFSGLDEGQSRLTMGARAVDFAHRLLRYYKHSTTRAFGQPIYPQVMLIFACLFLNKLSKTYGQLESTRNYLEGSDVLLTLPNCERNQVVDAIQATVEILQDQILSRCLSDHMCAAAVPGLSKIVAEHKQQIGSNSLLLGSSNTSSHSSTTGLPSFDFDLQSLDLLSDTRFLSGISNDSSFWFGQDWLWGGEVVVATTSFDLPKGNTP